MVLEGTDAPGATPLEPDDFEGLIPDHIGTRGELDEYEQANILQAERRLRAYGLGEILDDHNLRRLHGMMFGDTWEWAGQYRPRETTIGCDPCEIPVRLRNLCNNTRYQRDHAVYPPDELAARFHHELVSIHPFRNGNGRHARLATDLLLTSMDRPRFTWGRDNLVYAGEVRERYIAALRMADRGELQPLLEFVRS